MAEKNFKKIVKTNDGDVHYALEIVGDWTDPEAFVIIRGKEKDGTAWSVRLRTTEIKSVKEYAADGGE